MLKPMKPNRRAVLNVIVDGVARGRPPTLREIARSVGVAHTSVYRHLAALEAWGYIEREERIARGIKLGTKFMQR